MREINIRVFFSWQWTILTAHWKTGIQTSPLYVANVAAELAAPPEGLSSMSK
jgi:hypothetical protein